jgi:hypothetical protein
MPPSLSELKVIPSFCFAFKIPDDVTATNIHHYQEDYDLFHIKNFRNLAKFNLKSRIPTFER